MMKKITHKRELKGAITHVKVDGSEKTKQQVISDIPNNDYYTYIGDKQGSKIHKTKSGYISTNPNDDTRDNLDNLPNF
jgi:hypothetical protein